MFGYDPRAMNAIARVCGLVVLTCTVGKMPAQAQVPAPMFNPPKAYYLALGDSITYGYQAWKVRAGLPPSAFNTGYVDVFGARLRQIQPGITIVNYRCPGETSASFMINRMPSISSGIDKVPRKSREA